MESAGVMRVESSQVTKGGPGGLKGHGIYTGQDWMD